MGAERIKCRQCNGTGRFPTAGEKACGQCRGAGSVSPSEDAVFQRKLESLLVVPQSEPAPVSRAGARKSTQPRWEALKVPMGARALYRCRVCKRVTPLPSSRCPTHG